MQVKLTKIYTTNKDKAGNDLKSKKGAPYTRMSIKTEQHGDKWISGFKNKDNAHWKEGDTVEVNITESGQYLNFETPKVEDKNNEKLEKILNVLTGMKLELEIIKERLPKRNVAQMEPTDSPRPDEMPDFDVKGETFPDINPEDIPF